MKEITKIRLQIYGIAFCILFTIGFILYIAHRFEQTSQKIEQTKMCLSATGMIYSAVRIFVEEHVGQWPSSWEDLEGIKDPERPDNEVFDSEYCKKWVTVDFSIESTAIFDTTPKTFTGIQPRCDFPDEALEYLHSELVKTVKQFHSN